MADGPSLFPFETHFQDMTSSSSFPPPPACPPRPRQQFISLPIFLLPLLVRRRRNIITVEEKGRRGDGLERRGRPSIRRKKRRRPLFQLCLSGNFFVHFLAPSLFFSSCSPLLHSLPSQFSEGYTMKEFFLAKIPIGVVGSRSFPQFLGTNVRLFLLPLLIFFLPR